MVFDRQPTGRDDLRVLVADDDPIQRNLIAARLVTMKGEAVEAEDGLSAWSLLLSQDFDLAIVDLGMPDLDGFGLIQCMRGHPRTRHLPIVVVTSRGDRASMDAALHAGATSFLVKPIAWATFEHHLGFLMRLVRSADEARQAGQGALAAFEDLSKTAESLCKQVGSGTALLNRELAALKRSLAQANAAPEIMARIESAVQICVDLGRQSEQAALEAPAAPDSKMLGRPQEDFASILDETFGVVELVAESAGVRLTKELPPYPVAVAADRRPLVMALRYLLQDAIVRAGRGVDLNLSATIDGDGSLVVDIGGNSSGWPVDVIPRSSPPLEHFSSPLGRSSGPSIGRLLARTISEGFGGKLQLFAGANDEQFVRLVLPACSVRVLNVAA